MRVPSPRAVAVAMFVFIATFLALIAAAMERYPGGTWWEGDRAGHSFWANFICDLTQPTSLGGTPNPASALASTGMLSLSLALVPFWFLVTATFDNRILGRITKGAGVLSSAASVAVPLTPSLLFANFHAVSSVLSGLLGVVAALAAYTGMWRSASRPFGSIAFATCALASGSANGALYIWFLAGHPLSHAMPVAQKLAAIALLGWMTLVGRRACRAAPHTTL